jgi:nucleotide-binding universal stress UspA family protein
MDPQPVVVAFDGSEPAQAAIRSAVALFPQHKLVVVSVWEPGLALAMAGARDLTGVGYVPPTPAEMQAIDNVEREHAGDAAAAGARLAQELGATAEAHPAADEADVAVTVAAIAEEVDAAAIVIGSRGLGGVKSRLFGSTSRELLQRTDRPVLVVKAPA